MTDEELEAYYQKRTMTITVNDAVMGKSIYDKPKKHINQRNTAREAYKSIQPELGERQQQVYDCISQAKRPICDLEGSKHLGLPISSYVARRNELVEMGIVKEYTRSVNPETGKRVIYWQANG